MIVDRQIMAKAEEELKFAEDRKKCFEANVCWRCGCTLKNPKDENGYSLIYWKACPICESDAFKPQEKPQEKEIATPTKKRTIFNWFK